MNDHAIIPVDITYYYVDSGLFTGSGKLSEVVNLDEITDVAIWRCYGALGFSSSSIAVHSGEFDYEINRALHTAM